MYCVLGPEGCELHGVDAETSAKIAKELTITAKQTSDFVVPAPFPVYTQKSVSPPIFIVPRYWGLHHCQAQLSAHNSTLSPPTNLPMDARIVPTFKLDESKSQHLAVKAIRDALSVPYAGGGVLQLPTGSGKTAIAIFTATEIVRKRTLVVVHTNVLLEQWVERIQTFAPASAARIGRLQGGIVDVDGKDFVIGMLQSVSIKDYPPSTFDSFGLVLIDECHTINTEMFSRALPKFARVPHILGLSATPKRKDELDQIIHLHIGPIIFAANRVRAQDAQGLDAAPVIVKAVRVSSYPHMKEMRNRMGKVDQVGMITQLVRAPQRNALIADIARHEHHRKVLVLSERRQHLEELYSLLSSTTEASSPSMSVALYLGGMKRDELKRAEQADVILGTYHIASVGLDIPGLNVLILATPRSDVVQAVGRILRVLGIPKTIYDIVDSFGVYYAQHKKRLVTYRHERFQVVSVDAQTYADSASAPLRCAVKSTLHITENDDEEDRFV